MSDSGLLAEQLVGERDPETGAVRLTGWVPGPAGAAVLPLAGGELLVGVDRAEPSTVTFLELPGGSPRARSDPAEEDAARLEALLVPLLGDRAVALLSGLGPDPQVVVAANDLTFRRGPSPELLQVSRLAVLRTELEELELPELELGVALAELALLAERLDLGSGSPSSVGLSPTVAALRQGALDRLAGQDLDELDLLLDDDRGREDAAHALAGVVDEPGIVEGAPGLLRDVLAVVVRLRDRSGDGRAGAAGTITADVADAAMAPTPMAAAPAPAAIASRDLAAVPPPAPPADVQVVSSAPDVEVRSCRWEGDDLRVRVHRELAEGGLWLRVFAPAPPPASTAAAAPHVPVLLALVPFEASSFRTDEAVAFVDPSVDRSWPLLADVTAHPDEPAAAGPRPPAVDALELGRQAVRLARVGDREASATWLRCSERWSAAGDDRRATLARRYATAGPGGAGQPDLRGRGRRRPVEPPPPYLHDRLRT